MQQFSTNYKIFTRYLTMKELNGTLIKNLSFFDKSRRQAVNKVKSDQRKP